MESNSPYNSANGGRLKCTIHQNFKFGNTRQLFFCRAGFQTVEQKNANRRCAAVHFGGRVLTNVGLLPAHNEFLETIGEWGIVFIMFALGLEEDLGRFSQGLKRSIGIALIGAMFPFIAGHAIRLKARARTT